MNSLFTSDRERELFLLKKKRLKIILHYNLEQMQRKRSAHLNQKHEHIVSSHAIASQAMETLNYQSTKTHRKKEMEKMLLRDSYERQIRDKEQKIRLQKQMERQFFQRQKAFSDYEEARRIAEIQKMFDRRTYLATPLNSNKRSKTEPIQQESFSHNPEPQPFHLPRIAQKQQQASNNPISKNQQTFHKQAIGAKSQKKSLEDVFVQTFQKNRGTPAKH